MNASAKNIIREKAATTEVIELYNKSLAVANSLLIRSKTIKNLDLREAIELNHGQTNDFFKRAVERGDLVKHGNTSSTCYSLPKELTATKKYQKLQYD